ncbi:hypothetical protein JAAARDRAFT_62284 [Jaapia argillacea MUCL 33604]|uniref:Uncharacterized protein n=1 Tax=Jaapia argillacea MUCL 33604 TaxID=933084 RepID=A0A067PL38_9AGAM|nr:hypothetical protein JAAARDRAFT_62284 [Jaapia argillacea MUCL 33604]
MSALQAEKKRVRESLAKVERLEREVSESLGSKRQKREPDIEPKFEPKREPGTLPARIFIDLTDDDV